MYRFYLAAADMLPSVAVFIPIYCILSRFYYHSAGKTILYFLLSCYLSAVYVLVGLPNVTYIRPEMNLNLIPFIGMIADFQNSVLNILLFIPLGIMLPALWKKYRVLKRTLLFGFAMSIAIELLQILTFRATDVNDLITNTVGTFLGFLFAKTFIKKFPAAKDPADTTNSEELIIVSVIVWLVMFFIYPFVSALFWDLILS